MPKLSCAIPTCQSPAKARGWCAMHYQKWSRYGDPEHPTNPRYSTPEESFAARTKRQGDCLIWTGAKYGDGYGKITVRSTEAMSVHRWAYEKAHGPIPEGMKVDHTCHNPLCCNAEHLRLATQKQNGENRAGTNRNNKSSKTLGVSFDKQTGRWSASVMHNRKMYWGGRHDTEAQAAKAVAALRNSLFTHNDADRTAA
ncbi:AP2 domain-containing protein [Arthrobacter sp. SLBN-83]|uniref:HNH endonuclease n=1 Tax=Arthrobacter sp. SLBN-83 TaxID=2768449 RepID=UPI0011696944|nr:HNH endonuclease [Arthrobacter sp. SLBN-83]TQJ60508.1 AP2 domain-containing protein [Arthrobacter sp. SLBN-83]